MQTVARCLWLHSVIAKLTTLIASSNNTAVDPQRRASDGRGERAANKRYQARYLLRRLESFDEGARANAGEELLLKRLERLPGAQLADKVLDPCRTGRPGQHGIHRHARTGARLRQPARQRELCCLGRAVVNPLDGNLNG